MSKTKNPLPPDFCVFILTHGRPDKQTTTQSLKRHGYTGPIFYVIDDEDDTEDEYRERYGDHVLQFSKEAISKTFDEGDNFSDRRTITYARNACFDLAESIGFKYFVQLDDDYTDFRYRIRSDGTFHHRVIRSLDHVFATVLEFYKSCPQLLSVAIAQGGDFIGGHNTRFHSTLRTRKAMNSFFCSTSRRFNFIGRMNEDVNTYTSVASRGGLFLTIPMVALDQKQTQGTEGGITELYKRYGTYVKASYTVMYQPSSVKIGPIGRLYPRLHHRISWQNTVPWIVREELRKPRD